MIHPERIHRLNDRGIRTGAYVLYWMQASQRASGNHALEYAVREANKLKKPVVVLFGLTPSFPEANLRHYAFMLDGLREVEQALRDRGILFVLRRESPERAAQQLAQEASLVVADRGYLRIQKAWRSRVASKAPCAVVMVESDAVIPVETASGKEEYAARTLRPKIHKHLHRFLVPLAETPVKVDALGLAAKGLDLAETSLWLKRLEIDRTVQPVAAFKGGTARARQLLKQFLKNRLERYASDSNDPSLGCLSHMSPYLHFGQISPLEIALEIQRSPCKCGESKAAYLEQLIVRRELSMNFVHFNPDYDRYDALPDWAKRTLKSHRRDPRPWLYGREVLESAGTHDPFWNAAAKEMLKTGKMHNYMRMYWGKKILEWSPDPEEAFKRVLSLNNKYFLDGRDPNSFAGVAWCFGKHDRPWTERDVFGKVRYMNDAGLKRKFDMEVYVKRIEGLP